MLCKESCPRGTNCKPISNIVSTETFVCIGYHGEEKEIAQDRFRHCFKSETTDSMYDYDEYDLKSVLTVMAEALLTDELTRGTADNPNNNIMDEQIYTQAELESFGKYLLSEGRTNRIASIYNDGDSVPFGERLSQIYEADLQTWNELRTASVSKN